MTDQLTKSERYALSRLTHEWQSLYALRVGTPTLRSLVTRGLAEERGPRDASTIFAARGGLEYRLASTGGPSGRGRETGSGAAHKTGDRGSQAKLDGKTGGR